MHVSQSLESSEPAAPLLVSLSSVGMPLVYLRQKVLLLGCGLPGVGKVRQNVECDVIS